MSSRTSCNDIVGACFRALKLKCGSIAGGHGRGARSDSTVAARARHIDRVLVECLARGTLLVGLRPVAVEGLPVVACLLLVLELRVRLPRGRGMRHGMVDLVHGPLVRSRRWMGRD
jgi:hypothetical protein